MQGLNKYFDNGATSFPKPQKMVEQVASYIQNIGGTYGRSSHPRVQETTLLVEECRDMLLEKISGQSGSLVWTANATDATNMLLSGLANLKKVAVSPTEHNCVMRPLHYLGIEYDVLPHNSDCSINLQKLKDIDFSQYSLVIINHQSNVNGVVQDIAEIKKIIGQTPLMLDCSQSIGERDIFVESWGVDYMVFTAHKGLLGLSGLGGFYARDISTVATSRFGGTGSKSDSFEMPDFYPDRFQAGTPNTVGIVALYYAMQNTPKAQHTFSDFVNVVERINKIPSLKVYCSTDYRNIQNQGELFSLVSDKYSVAEFAGLLLDKFGIETRSGLHCAPLIHEHLGTLNGGSVRISFSKYHNVKDLDYLCGAIISLCE